MTTQPEITIEPPRGLFTLDIVELWHYRELLIFLAWRDIKVRYKQTFFGAAWAILQPLLIMALFSVIFGRLAGLTSEGIPYPIFTFTALIPWQLFSYALTQSSSSMITDQNLVRKVYFPRLLLPLSSVISGLLDFGISLFVVFGLIWFYHVQITWRIFAVPLLIIFAVMTALSVGIWLSALNVQYRDVRYAVPFLVQIWMYATPVAYSASLIPSKFRWLISLNPMTGVVEGFRWALLGTNSPIGYLFYISFAIMLIFLIGGIIYFRQMEDSFADLI